MIVDDRQRSILLTALQGLDLQAPQLGIDRGEITTLLKLFASPIVMPRYDPRFTEQDQQSMFEAALDEGSDLSRKEIAQLVMDSWDLCSCVAACTIIAGEHSCEDLARMLQHFANEEETYVNGEFLRLNDDDGDNYAALLDFAKRMKLINDDETELTELGREYMESLI